MNRVARVVFTGVLAGLAIFIIGNVADITGSFFLKAADTAGKTDVAATVLLTFLFDILIGFFITVAYGIVRRGLPANRVFGAISFAAVLVLAGALPRTADAFLWVKIPNAALSVWLAGWIIEAAVASFVIVLLYPTKGKPAQAETAEPAKI